MTSLSPIPLPTYEKSAENRLYAKVTWRLIPFLCLCYFCAYLDRVNVGFAKLQMLDDLQWSETVYSLGAGIFFVGYILVEVPSNILLQRVGAKRWIARIMITWSLLSAATAFVTTPAMFYVLRFLLGVAEAGFLPGIILYLTYWYPADRRAKITAFFYCAIPLSGVIGGPLSGWIMSAFSGVSGLQGWQWLFLLEAAPSLLVGIAVLFILDDGIRHARWLTPMEKSILERNIQSESDDKLHHSIAQAFKDPRVWLMGLIFFTCAMGIYTFSFWLPSLIKDAGVKDVLNVGLLVAVPYAFGMVSMVLWARHSDQTRERRWHLAIAMAVGAVGLALSTLTGYGIYFVLPALTLASVGIQAMAPIFWSMPTAFLGGAAAAAGIALITAIANIGGLTSTYLVGWIKDLTGSAEIGLYAVAAVLVAGSVITLAAVPARLVNK